MVRHVSGVAGMMSPEPLHFGYTTYTHTLSNIAAAVDRVRRKHPTQDFTALSAVQ